jgi:hypothetical protein
MIYVGSWKELYKDREKVWIYIELIELLVKNIEAHNETIYSYKLHRIN